MKLDDRDWGAPSQGAHYHRASETTSAATLNVLPHGVEARLTAQRRGLASTVSDSPADSENTSPCAPAAAAAGGATARLERGGRALTCGRASRGLSPCEEPGCSRNDDSPGAAGTVLSGKSKLLRLPPQAEELRLTAAPGAMGAWAGSVVSMDDWETDRPSGVTPDRLTESSFLFDESAAPAGGAAPPARQPRQVQCGGGTCTLTA